MRGSGRNACCEAKSQIVSRSCLSRILVGPRLPVGARRYGKRAHNSHFSASMSRLSRSPMGGAMRNEGRRRGPVGRLLDFGRGELARIAPCLMGRCSKETTPPDRWRGRPAPSPIGPRVQSSHPSRFASPSLKAAVRAPLSGAEWLTDIDVDAVVDRRAGCGPAGATREQADRFWPATCPIGVRAMGRSHRGARWWAAVGNAQRRCARAASA